jgi:cell wall-associated NlpC family hydrolase
MMAALGVFTMMGLLFHATHASAKLTHKVKPGENLYRIAKTYGLKVKDLKEANRLSSSLIHPGNVLEIPVPGEEKGPAEDPGDLSTKPRLTEHQVVKGENLYRIARRNDMTVRELMELNRLTSKKLRIGQVLRVPDHDIRIKEPLEEKIEDGMDAELEEGMMPEGDGPSLNEGEMQEAVAEDPLDSYLSELSEIDSATESSLIAFARKYLGAPYRFGGENPKKGIDCSAFVQRVFRYFSIDLPRTAREQFKAGIKVSKNDLQAGDLIFFKTYAKYPSHVGIYMGGGKMIHASSRYKKVTISSVDLPYYKKRFIGVIRIPDAENLLLSQNSPALNQ